MPDGRSPRCEGTLTPMTTETTTAQLWICESCGFIYDPAEGDPDGGIPPGTAFDDIPGSLFCPGRGPRKKGLLPHGGAETPPGPPPRRGGSGCGGQRSLGRGGDRRC